MANATPFKPGQFCWIELVTTDARKARAYYGELLGWSFNDMPVGGGMTYSMLMKGAGSLGGLYEMDDQMKSKGMHAHWRSYVSVENVDASVKKAQSLGAKILQDPMDVMDAGRMAALQDPNGAAFCLWQPKKHTGSSVDPYTPGAWCWNECGTNDLAKAKNFYSQLFGWQIKESDKSSMDYSEFSLSDGRPFGGMYQITPEMKKMGVQPHWMVYFTVDDIEKRTEQAKKLGGEAYVECQEAGHIGRFSIIADGQEAPAAYIQLTQKW